VKHSRLLYGSLAVLGIVFLTLCLVGIYLNAIDAISVFAALPSEFVLWFLSIGIFFLTVGIVGTGRQHLKSHKRLFTALAAVLVPVLTFVAMFFALTMIVVNTLFIFPMRSEIAQVTVVDTNPLVLSVDVKALTSRDSIIDGANVMNRNDVIIAEIFEREYIVSKNWRGSAMAILPSGSEITLTLDFNTTLPSGNYVIKLHGGMHDNHGSAPFTVP